MYNQEVKKEYIKYNLIHLDAESRGRKAILQSYFERMEFSENFYDKDLCNFTKNEIITSYKLLNITSLLLLKAMNSTFTKYAEFCHSKSLCDFNYFRNVNTKDLANCLNKEVLGDKIFTREDFLKLILTFSPRERFAFLALYEGLKGRTYNEILNLKLNDCDKENKILHLQTRDITVSDELLKFIEEATKNDYGFYYPSRKSLKLIDNGYVYKMSKSGVCNKVIDKPASPRVLSDSISKAFDMMGYKNIKANNIRDSGKIDMIKKRSEHYNISPVEYLYSENLIKEVEVQFDCKIVPSVFYRTFEDHLIK